VEGELALHHAEGSRAAHSDSYAYAYPDSDDSHAYPDAHPDSDDYVSYAHPDSDDYVTHAHAHASGCCSVRSGAVVLQHRGAELLRE
jgi:hypothetical protein